MTPTLPIEVYTNKARLTFLLLGCVIFVLGGIWFITHPNDFRTPNRTPSPYWIMTIGVSSLMFFGACFVTLLIRLLNRAPVLVIGEEGIQDNWNFASAGLIPWEDVVDISAQQVMNQQFIMVIVKNPESYIERQTSALKRMIMRKNYESYGSPVSISPNGLKIAPAVLQQTLLSAFRNAKSI